MRSVLASDVFSVSMAAHIRFMPLVGDLSGEVVQAISGTEDEAAAISLARELGLSVRSLDSEVKERLGLARKSGAYVEAVDPGSPADLAGMRAGSLIVSVDRIEFEGLDDLGRSLAAVIRVRRFSLGASVPLDPTDESPPMPRFYWFAPLKKDFQSEGNS